MATLAHRMQYVNATMASQLLQNSQLLNQNAFAGGGGQNGGSPPIAMPSLSNLPSLSIPPVGGPPGHPADGLRDPSARGRRGRGAVPFARQGHQAHRHAEPPWHGDPEERA